MQEDSCRTCFRKIEVIKDEFLGQQKDYNYSAAIQFISIMHHKEKKNIFR